MALTPATKTDVYDFRSKFGPLIEIYNIADFDTSGSEKVVALIKVLGMDEFNVIYKNKSAANAHTVKVYGTIRNDPPSAVSDAGMKELYSVSVALGTTSDPMAFTTKYVWIVITSNGTTETDIADIDVLVMGKN